MGHTPKISACGREREFEQVSPSKLNRNLSVVVCMGAEESLFFPELVRLDWSTAQSETSTDLPVQHIAILSAPGRLIQFFPGAQLKTI